MLLALAKLRLLIARTDNSNLTLDFSQTAQMFTSATLLFVAELRRLIWHKAGAINFAVVLPQKNKVAQVLKQVGVLDLLGVTTQIECVDDDVINWRYASGSSVEGEKYDDILSAYDGDIAPSLSRNLYKGITEAMANVANHAYSLPRRDGLNLDHKGWWMFSQEKDGVLSICFCDLGAGIPATLPMKRPNVWKKILRLGKTSHGDIIKHAVKDSISRTGDDHRGKGLGQIVRAAQEIGASMVAVLSNRGGYYRNAQGGAKIDNYNDSVMGTLITWNIPLKVQDENHSGSA